MFASHRASQKTRQMNSFFFGIGSSSSSLVLGSEHSRKRDKGSRERERESCIGQCQKSRAIPLYVRAKYSATHTQCKRSTFPRERQKKGDEKKKKKKKRVDFYSDHAICGPCAARHTRGENVSYMAQIKRIGQLYLIITRTREAQLSGNISTAPNERVYERKPAALVLLYIQHIYTLGDASLNRHIHSRDLHSHTPRSLSLLFQLNSNAWVRIKGVFYRAFWKLIKNSWYTVVIRAVAVNNSYFQ